MKFPLFRLAAITALFALCAQIFMATGMYAAWLVLFVGSAVLANPRFSPGLCANTLTSLIPDIYAALDVVSRELVGLIQACARDSRADRVAANQTLRIPISPANAAGGNITPAMTLPAAADQTILNNTLTISKQRFFPFSWTGEEQKSVDYGPGFLTLKQYQIAQAIRAAVNEVEVDVATAAYQGASRAFGTAGTTPFATSIVDLAQIKKILDDNGTPMSDRSLVMNTTAGVNFRSLANLYKVNEAADASLLRKGTLGSIYDFGVRESAQIPTVTKGTGAGYLVNNGAGYPIGATAITVDTGAGTILKGDVITFAGDTNKYVVGAALSGAVVTLALPGLRQAVADNAAITVGNNFAGNVAFSRNAVLLATRLPAIPEEGDQASDRMVVTDPNSGLSFEFAVYPGFRMNVYHVSLAWGVSAIKPEHIAILLG